MSRLPLWIAFALIACANSLPATTQDCTAKPLPNGCPCGHKWDCSSGVCGGDPPTCTGPTPTPPTPPAPPIPPAPPTPPAPPAPPTPSDCSIKPLRDGCACGHGWDCASQACTGDPPMCTGPEPPAPAPPIPPVSGRVHSVYAYNKAGISAGYRNPQGLGCNPMTDPKQTEIFINFVSDVSSGVAEVKLDASALINGGAAGNQTYVDVINRLTAAGIGVHLTVSLAMQNDTPNDVKGFHAAFEALASQMPSTVLGVTYDIEEPKVQDGTKYKAAWVQVWALIKSFTEAQASSRGAHWSGYDMALPGACIEECGASPWIYQSARALDSMYYFNGIRTFYKEAIVNIVTLADKCQSCKVRIGFEVTDEASRCYEYVSCKQSFVWGGGLASGQSLVDWINTVMLPEAATAGLSADKLATPPFFVEDLSGYIPFMQNVKDGVFPCSTCSKDGGVDNTCPAPGLVMSNSTI